MPRTKTDGTEIHVAMLLSDRSRRELLDLHGKLGIQSRSDLIRFAIHKLHVAECEQGGGK